MYGRGSSSIAEQMGITKKDAEKVISDFFEEFPKVADFVTSSQENAREFGFVETACGRKRRLPDMQLDVYEMTRVQSDSSSAFDMLDFDDIEEEDTFVDDDTWYYWASKMDKAWGAVKRNAVKEEALKEGISIIDNGGKVADAERQCVNSIIQGSSADITKTAMNKLHNDEKLKELGFRLLLTVHDEVIGEAPVENAKEASERMEHIMLNAASEIVDVPMSCDVEISIQWYGEKIKL